MAETRPGSRVERDSMGEVQVPEDALWGASTQRAIENFGTVSAETMPLPVIAALIRIKAAAAAVNARLGVLAPDMAAAIGEACGQVVTGLEDTGLEDTGLEDTGLEDTGLEDTGHGAPGTGARYSAHFPVPVFQTGSGTSTNMNVNEVVARIASERLGRPVHPNDHVNASQSSNDVFPSAVHMAVARLLTSQLIGSLRRLAQTLDAKAAQFADVVKTGRTHLMDATPITLGQEFGGYAAAIRHGVDRVKAVVPEVAELPLGGTAVGTGLNAPQGFARLVIERLSSEHYPLSEARNHFEAAGGRDALVAASGVLRTVAVSLYKICNDLRLMNSGPRAGLAEIVLPELQPGSSIMPGKVNPVIPEVVCQVCAQVIGNDAAIAFAGAAGNFELNVMIPVIARNLVASVRLLQAATTVLADRCVAGIEAHPQRLREGAESSPAIVTALNPYIGYDEAASVAHEALATGHAIRDIVIGHGFVQRGAITAEQLDQVLDVLAMARPHNGRSADAWSEGTEPDD